MKDVTQFLENADRYLDGLMSPQERDRFEGYCRDNDQAREMLEEQTQFRGLLRGHGEHADLRRKLAQAHRNWEASGQKETSRDRVSVEGPAPIVFLRRFYWKAAGVAAAIALMIALGGVWISRTYNTHKITSYTLLRREIDNIRRSQNSLMNDMQKPQSPAPANPGQYGGTGFAISSMGLIATNAHVIAGADSIYVETSKGESLKATLLYQDTQSDLAILKIADSTFRLAPLPYDLRKSTVPLGDEVYTLGYPRDEIVYGKGYISSETGFRGDSCSYQISMPVNPGNSGGPLIDEKGQILGVITGKQSPSDDIAFAVKSSYLLSMLDSLPAPYQKKALQYRNIGLGHLSRINQIKKLQPYIFLVKVYN